MTAIRLDAVTKRFGAHVALDDVSLDFADGSFTALLGPSGCGKTTILRLVAGFERPTAGSVRFAGREVSSPTASLAPEERNVGVVFQSYALWPHMTVAENVAYPLSARRVPSAERAAAVARTLDQVGLGSMAGRRPDELSGGQRQRVALARAIVAETAAVLFDEPLANLDVHLRARLIEEFRRIHRETGRTMIYVTHDQAEAIALADRLVVMSAGRVLQAAAPRTVYREPADAAVAAFVGRGSIVPATVETVADGMARVNVGNAEVMARCGSAAKPGPARLLLRPESLALSVGGPLWGEVARCTYRGPVSELEIALDGGGSVVLDADRDMAPGTPARIAVADAWVVPAGS